MIKSKPLSGEHEDLGEPARSKRPSTPALGLIELGALQGAVWSRRAGAGQVGENGAPLRLHIRDAFLFVCFSI